MEHPPFWAAEALAAFIRDQASWRRTQAERFPEDSRNLRSAAALEELATYVEQLPSTDRSLNELCDLGAFDDDNRLVAGVDARRAISRYRFDETHLQQRDVLNDLVAIMRRARRSPAQKRTEMTVMLSAKREWVRDQPRRPWHAVARRFGEDQVETLCGARLDLGGASDTTIERSSSDTGQGCAICDAVDRGAAIPRQRDSEVVAEIFLLAEAHSRAVGAAAAALRSALSSDRWDATDLLSTYSLTVADLHAAIALAASSKAQVVGPLNARDGGILSLHGDDLDRFLRSIFDDAGIGLDFVLESRPTQVESRIEIQFPVALRRGICDDLERARVALRALPATPTDDELHNVEQHLLNARDSAEPVKAAHAPIQEAIRCVRALRRGATAAGRLEFVGTVLSAITAVTTNLVPEDKLDVGSLIERREALLAIIEVANAGDTDAIELLHSRPELAFFDDLSKKWVEQRDSGRGPGLAAGRDEGGRPRIIRTRRDE
jgi:hypothetical protein